MKIVVMDDDGHIVTLPSAQEVPSWLKKNRADSKMSMQEVGDQLGVTKSQRLRTWLSLLASSTRSKRRLRQ